MGVGCAPEVRDVVSSAHPYRRGVHLTLFSAVGVCVRSDIDGLQGLASTKSLFSFKNETKSCCRLDGGVSFRCVDPFKIIYSSNHFRNLSKKPSWHRRFPIFHSNDIQEDTTSNRLNWKTVKRPCKIRGLQAADLPSNPSITR